MHGHPCSKLFPAVSCRDFKRNFIIVRKVSSQQLYHLPTLHLPASPHHHKKESKSFQSFVKGGKYLSREKGCDYAFRKGQKVKERQQEKKMTKASHCSSSSTLEVVVQRLARLGLG